ncbi:MAG: hypothetical protein Q8807_02470 ['Waltheria sp.' little leaf phytoplasma]|nr:hypothetical protein ['Waltheria sp.' little leaf phytoplasma]
MQIFKKLNDLLAKIHVFKGIPRLKQVCNFLFLKLFYDARKGILQKNIYFFLYMGCSY